MFRGIFSPPKNATTDGGFVALNLTSASKLQEVDSSPLSSAFLTPSSEFEANAILAADAPTVEYIDLDSKTILKSPSFPDWYFHFRVQFLRGSEARKTYCMIPLEDFRARLSGSCEEIEKVVETLDLEFHHGFYKLLSNVLSKDDDRFFSRQFVEDNFYDIVEKYYKEDGFNTGEPRNDKIIRGTTVYPVDQTYIVHSNPSPTKTQVTTVHTKGQHTLAFKKMGNQVVRVNTSVMNREKDTTLVTRIKGREVVLGSTTLRKRTSYTETRINE